MWHGLPMKQCHVGRKKSPQHLSKQKFLPRLKMHFQLFFSVYAEREIARKLTLY